jgi:hypothetical protein
MLCYLYTILTFLFTGPVDCTNPEETTIHYSSGGFRYQHEVPGRDVSTYYELEGPFPDGARAGISFGVRF